MTRQGGLIGRPGYPVVDPSLVDFVQGAVTGTMLATGSVNGPDRRTDVGRRVEWSSGDLRYQGAMRVQSLARRGGDTPVAGDVVMTADYLVSLRHIAEGIRAEDIVRVTTPDGGSLRLKVESVTKGSLTWVRDLLCSETQEPGARV